MIRWFGVLAAAAWMQALAGCAPPCATVDEDPVTFEGGNVNASKTLYESSTIDGQYLHFPGGRRYELKHGLAAKPVEITTYLAFQERPLPESSFSESAGNQALIEAVDEELVRVFNDTCAEFYLRVVARTDPTMGDAGTPGDSSTGDSSTGDSSTGDAGATDAGGD